MLLQTNSYIVPREERLEHAKLLRRFRQTLLRLGCDHFEVYEQVGANWNASEASNRFVQIMRFRDRRHQQEVQSAERADAAAQKVIADFCELINFSYQQQQGLFAQGFYTSFMRMPPTQSAIAEPQQEIPMSVEPSTGVSMTGEVLPADHSAQASAEPYDESVTDISAALEEDSQDTMIEAESRPAPSGEDEDDLPPIDNTRQASHASESSPGNNGHALDDDE